MFLGSISLRTVSASPLRLAAVYWSRTSSISALTSSQPASERGRQRSRRARMTVIRGLCMRGTIPRGDFAARSCGRLGDALGGPIMPAAVAKPKATTFAGISSGAVERATGKPWADWLKILDKSGAKKRPHKEIAIYLHEECGVGEWWAQMVTVGYEQARGLREQHQKGEFYSIGGSKTVNVPVAELFRAWSDARRRGRWLPGARLEVRRATADKSMRITWEPGETGPQGGTNVDVNFFPAGTGKSKVSVEHDKL